MAFSMRRKVVLFCLLLAMAQRTVGQSISIGFSLPCEGAGGDPDPLNPGDNLSCSISDQGQLQCYSMGQLCDGTLDCIDGSDEDAPLDCGKSQLYNT